MTADTGHVPPAQPRDEARGPRATGAQAGPTLCWVAEVPLVTNPVVLRALAITLGLAYLLVAGIFAAVLASDGWLDRLPRVLGAMAVGFGLVALLCLLVMLVVFRNRMRLRFVLDDTGFSTFIVDRRAQVAGSLAVFAGGLSGNDTLAGAGLVQKAGPPEHTPWARVGGARFDPARHRILLTARGWWPVGAIQCDAESYPAVAARVREMLWARGIPALPG